MIVPMKKLTLVALKANRDEVLSKLQSISAVQLTPPEETAAEEGLLPALESRVQRLEAAAGVLKPYGSSGGLLSAKPERTVSQLSAGIEPAMELCEKVEELDRRIASLKSEAEKKDALTLALAPWKELDARLEEIGSPKTARCVMGMLPPAAIAELEAADAVVEVYGGEKDRAVLIACHEADWADISQRIRGAGFQEVSFPGIRGTAAENMARLNEEAEHIRKEQETVTAELAALGARRGELLAAYDGAVIARDREQSKQELGATAETFLLEGWARADMLDDIRAAVEGVTDAYYMDFTDPQEGDAVPTVLKNSKLVTPYEAVTNLYSLPAYGSVDGTPLMMPFYFIFFGMMLSDTVYGAVLALGAWIFIKKAKPEGMLGNLAKVLFMGGLSTIVMGLLFGTFAGVAWPVIFKGTGIENVFPLIDSATEPIAMLALCAGMGIVHMFYAVFISAAACIKKGDWMGAIIDNLCWVVIITGLLMLAAPMLGLPAVVGTIGKWMAIAAAAAVLLFAGRSNKKIMGRLAGGAGKLYDVTAWLGDVLSYARIFALGLSTGVIGLVLNTLCWDMLFASFKGNTALMIIGFIIVTALSVALHVFMMAISTLGCFVHTARLQYVEFFGKFYESGGKAFRPLGYRTKHVKATEK